MGALKTRLGTRARTLVVSNICWSAQTKREKRESPMKPYFDGTVLSLHLTLLGRLSVGGLVRKKISHGDRRIHRSILTVLLPTRILARSRCVGSFPAQQIRAMAWTTHCPTHLAAQKINRHGSNGPDRRSWPGAPNNHLLSNDSV